MSIEINKITKENELQQQEQASNLSIYTIEPSRRFNFIYDDDNDDEESTIPLNEIISQNPSSIAITPFLPTEDPEDFLIMGNKDLNTIPKKESEKFKKYSVEDFVPIPSESKDTVDDESLSDEDIPDNNVKIYSNPLFEFDDEYISSDVNPRFNEVLEDIESKACYDSNRDEPALLVTSLFDANKDECFDLGGDVDEINAFDMPSDFEDGYYDSKGDVLYLESLLSDDTTANLPPDVFLDRDPRNLTNINDLKIMVKVFDPGISEKTFSPTYVSLPFKDRHYLFLTYVIRIFLPYFTYPVGSFLPLSSGSKDINFDIFAFYFSSLELVASHQSGTFMCSNVYPNILNESPMEICSFTHFITMI
nr:hypothetical protein [Tanacetum cinerariifolium]